MLETKDTVDVTLVSHMGGDQAVCDAARVRPSECTERLIRYLMSHRHGTPFEHGAMTFRVHAPIFVWREWMRHRHMSYNEESARYKKLEPVFWVPSPERKLVPIPGFKSSEPHFQSGTPQQHAMVCEGLKDAYAYAYAEYESLLSQGIAREVARACLPVGIYSACYVTCNPRSLMHFLSLRTHEETAAYPSYPQAEIEDAARQCEAYFAHHWPLTHAAFNAHGRVAP